MYRNIEKMQELLSKNLSNGILITLFLDMLTSRVAQSLLSPKISLDLTLIV